MSTPRKSPPVTIANLWCGDRFKIGKDVWTYIERSSDGIHAVARRHSPECRKLGARSYGYIGDSICSFALDERVKFLPV